MADLDRKQRGSGLETAFGLRERLLAGLVVVPVIVIVSLLPLQPPEAIGESAPASDFSAARAMTHIEQFARAPHPMGTPEHARVRDYVVRQVESLGLEAVVQTDTLVDHSDGGSQIARVRNVLARLEGSQRGRAILLVAHYDTVPHSPGASDNGSGVAALLETLRALKQGPALANDVIFLFSDGEERGLLGAKAFHELHPWAADVALTLNFEARGAKGPSIMFETGPGPGDRIRQFASLTPRPLAYSYSADVYRYLPNDTDFSVFKRAGTPGFNFAFIHDVGAYHSSVDSVDRLDPRSLQHHGSHALALTRGFGDADLTAAGDGDEMIYFSLPLLGLVAYSSGWVVPLSVLLAVLVLLYFGYARKRLAIGRVVLGVLAVPAIIAAVAVAATAVHTGLFAAFVTGRGLLSHPSLYRLGLVLISLAFAVGLFVLIGRKLGVVNLSSGAMVWGLILALASASYLPSTSYLLAWPLFFSVLALFVLVRGSGEGGLARATGALLLVLAIPAILLWAPTVSLVGAAFGAGSATVLAVSIGLVAGSLSPQVLLLGVGSRRPWTLPAAILTIGLVLAGWQAAGARFDVERPRSNSLFYGLDTEKQTAVWASLDEEPDAWTSQFLPSDVVQRQPLSDFFGSPDVSFLVAEAPIVSLGAPVVTLATDEPAADGSASPADPSEPAMPEIHDRDEQRRLSLRVASVRQAPSFFLELRSDSAIRTLSIDGQEMDVSGVPQRKDTPRGHWRAFFYGAFPDGVDIEIEMAGTQPLSVAVVDRVYRLPEVPGFTYEPRPDGMIPDSGLPTDCSLVRSVFVF